MINWCFHLSLEYYSLFSVSLTMVKLGECLDDVFVTYGFNGVNVEQPRAAVCAGRHTPWVAPFMWVKTHNSAVVEVKQKKREKGIGMSTREKLGSPPLSSYEQE